VLFPVARENNINIARSFLSDRSITDTGLLLHGDNEVIADKVESRGISFDNVSHIPRLLYYSLKMENVASRQRIVFVQEVCTNFQLSLVHNR